MTPEQLMAQGYPHGTIETIFGILNWTMPCGAGYACLYTGKDASITVNDLAYVFVFRINKQNETWKAADINGPYMSYNSAAPSLKIKEQTTKEVISVWTNFITSNPDIEETAELVNCLANIDGKKKGSFRLENEVGMRPKNIARIRIQSIQDVRKDRNKIMSTQLVCNLIVMFGLIYLNIMMIILIYRKRQEIRKYK